MGECKPDTIASFTKFLLLKQESMITEQHLDLEKLRLNFPLAHSYTVCATSRLVLSVTSSAGQSKDLNVG